MKIKIIVFVLFIINLTAYKAQEYSFHALGDIKVDNTVKGYYFLISEEKSRKVKEFTLEIFNPDMVSTAKVTFTVHPDFVVKKNMPMTHPSMVQFLQNISFVDNFMMLQVYKMKELDVVESKLYVIDILKNSIVATIDANAQYYFLVSGGVIIRANGPTLERIDNNNHVLWSTIIKDDEYKSVGPFHNGRNAISKFNSDLFKVSVSKSGGKEKGVFEDLRLLDVKTGKEVFKFAGISGEAINYTPEYIQQIADGNYVVTGSYKAFVEKGKDNPDNGLFFHKLNKEGKVLASKKYSYNDYIKKCMPAKKADRLSMDHVRYKGILYSNNKIGLILCNTGFSYFSMRLKEKAPVFANDKAADVATNGLCLFEVDDNLEFVKWNTLNGRMETPEYKSDDQKLTEYFFGEPVINKSDNSMTLNAVVLNSKSFKDKTKFVSVKLANSKITGTDEIEVNQDATWVDFIDAKPGYILIAEYYEKEKRLDKRLEKLSYQ